MIEDTDGQALSAEFDHGGISNGWASAAEFDHGRILEVPIGLLRPAEVNEQVYRPVDPEDSEVQALADSIDRDGLLEPIVATLDDVIISGHRRHVACHLAGLDTVPCRRIDITSDHPEFLTILVEFNRQRNKTAAERLREEVIAADPEESYERLVEHRRQRSRVSVKTIAIVGTKRRAKITKAKQPFLDAILRVLRERAAFWPLSDRQIHYALLNYPPLIHASKPDSRYANTEKSYKACIDLLSRARLFGLIPWRAIHDPTRPVTQWSVHRDQSLFVRDQLDDFLKGYFRDLMQSQPNHVEVIGEKNTIESVVRGVVADYCIPYTIGRGYCSLPPRWEMAERFRKSGKERLVLLALSDFEPEGEDIAHSFARSMRDDFGIRNIEPIKVALNSQQVRELKLPPILKAKQDSSRFDGFVGKHGDDVFELDLKQA
jgi:ParB-like chromosome segregation protein Spo0J